MKYMGSKNRHAKELLPIILKNRKPGQYYIEPFVGGANMIDKVKGLRIGSDINYYLIELLIALSNGWLPPKFISEDEYNHIKNNQDDYPPHFVGYVGFQLSFGAKWMDNYRNSNDNRNYSFESFRNVFKQAPNLIGIDFRNCCYDKLNIPDNSLIYCDPPYDNTTGYKVKFDSDKFWDWCRNKVNNHNNVFISEYTAPNDFVCVWGKKVCSSLSKNTGAKKNIERLFQHKSQILPQDDLTRFFI